ncbi:hypothetical protein BVIET440_70231 [Burkholderia vietnamiensis]
MQGESTGWGHRSGPQRSLVAQRASCHDRRRRIAPMRELGEKVTKRSPIYRLSHRKHGEARAYLGTGHGGQ